MLKTIQAGRGLAALAVAAFHLTLALQNPKYFGWPVLGSITWRGNLGVDFFFVLSGFIIAYIHHDDIGRPAKLMGYVSKRFQRLYPIYWIYLAAVCLWWSMTGNGQSHLPASALEWVSGFSLIRLDGFIPPIVPAWTLFHEVAFYALFSVLIFNRRLGLAAMAAVMLASAALFQYPLETDRPPILDYLSAYNLHFLVGIAAFLLVKHGRRWIAATAAIAGALMLVGCVWAEARGVEFVAFPLLYALSFGGLVAGAVSWEKSRAKALSLPLLTVLGNASYSIYLTHMIVEQLASKLAFRFEATIGPYGVFVLALVATIAVGCAAYLFIERPLLAFVRERLSQARQPRATLEARHLA